MEINIHTPRELMKEQQALDGFNFETPNANSGMTMLKPELSVTPHIFITQDCMEDIACASFIYAPYASTTVYFVPLLHSPISEIEGDKIIHPFAAKSIVIALYLILASVINPLAMKPMSSSSSLQSWLLLGSS